MSVCHLCTNKDTDYWDKNECINACMECLVKIANSDRCVRCNIRAMELFHTPEEIDRYLEKHKIAKFILGRR